MKRPLKFMLEDNHMRFEVVIQPLDLHTNHYFYKLTDHELQQLQEAVQHQLKMSILKLKAKHDLSKVQS